MRPTKRQRQELRNKEYCKKYLTTDWDGCAANEYFANKCDNTIADKYFGKPKSDFFNSILEIGIAENDVYKAIAHLAFNKIKITSFLNNLTESNIYIPENINDKQKYVRVYMSK